MPRYKFPNGNEQDLSEETAALYPDLEKVADESYDERVERERWEAAQAAAAKVQTEDENGNDVVPEQANLSDEEKAALLTSPPADGAHSAPDDGSIA